jgi:CheY-like chemotaxis protein
MIIDDSSDMRELLKILLESTGYLTELTSDGAEALRSLNAVSSLEMLPDLILLDLRMPVMNGYEFLDARDRIERLKGIPVVVMSGDDDTSSQSLNETCCDVLTKPLNLRSILATVDRNLLH